MARAKAWGTASSWWNRSCLRAGLAFFPEWPSSLAVVPAGPGGRWRVCGGNRPESPGGRGRSAGWRGMWQSLAAVPSSVLPWRAALSSRSHFSSSSDRVLSPLSPSPSSRWGPSQPPTLTIPGPLCCLPLTRSPYHTPFVWEPT